jgi:hypothetical protein
MKVVEKEEREKGDCEAVALSVVDSLSLLIVRIAEVVDSR